MNKATIRELVIPMLEDMTDPSPSLLSRAEDIERGLWVLGSVIDPVDHALLLALANAASAVYGFAVSLEVE